MFQKHLRRQNVSLSCYRYNVPHIRVPLPQGCKVLNSLKRALEIHPKEGAFFTRHNRSPLRRAGVKGESNAVIRWPGADRQTSGRLDARRQAIQARGEELAGVG